MEHARAANVHDCAHESIEDMWYKINVQLSIDSTNVNWKFSNKF